MLRERNLHGLPPPLARAAMMRERGQYEATVPSPAMSAAPPQSQHQQQQNQQHQQQHHQQQQQYKPSDIPPLTYLTPGAIFVPLPADLAANPLPPPADRVARLRAILARLDEYAAQVRSNAVALVRRECFRVLSNALAAEPELPGQLPQSKGEDDDVLSPTAVAQAAGPGPGHGHGHGHPQHQRHPQHAASAPAPAPSSSTTLTPDDYNAMIANMSAPKSVLTATIGDASIAADPPPRPDFTKVSVHSHREMATYQIMASVSRLLDELTKMDMHFAQTRREYEAALKREMEADEVR